MKVGADLSSGLTLSGTAEVTASRVGTRVAQVAEVEAVNAAKSVGSDVKLLGTARENLLKAVENPKLRNIVNDLYRPGAKVGSGSSMDAFRLEQLTGKMVGGKTHGTKLLNYRTALKRLWNNRAGLSESDKQIIKQLLNDIQNGLSGY